MIPLASLVGGDDEAPNEPELPSLSRERAAFLAETRRNAEADAIRHAEDLLNRELPIVTVAERRTESRLADLRAEYVEKRGKLEAEARVYRQNAEAAQGHLQLAENALRQAGVSEEELGLSPLPPRQVDRQHVVVVVGVVAAGVLVLSILLHTVLLAMLGLSAAVGLAFWLGQTPVDEAEPAKMRRLRENWREANSRLQATQEREARSEAEIELLERSTYSTGQGEIAFAGEITATYENAAFSALPAGTLEGGREFPPQRAPNVEVPAWLQALAPEDE